MQLTLVLSTISASNVLSLQDHGDTLFFYAAPIMHIVLNLDNELQLTFLRRTNRVVVFCSTGYFDVLNALFLRHFKSSLVDTDVMVPEATIYASNIWLFSVPSPSFTE